MLLPIYIYLSMKAQNVHPAHPDFIFAPPAKFDSAPGAEQTRGGGSRGGFRVLVRGVRGGKRSKLKIFCTPISIFCTPCRGCQFLQGGANH